MKLSRAEIETARAPELMEQLCRHWEQQHPVEWDRTHAKIALPEGYVQMMPSAAALSVYLEVERPADQDRLESLVEEELGRLAPGAPLGFRWLRS